MTEPINEHAATAARLVKDGATPEYLSDKAIDVAKVFAVLALAGEVRALREQLEGDLGPTGAVAGFLDEIAVRLAPDGDSISEAIVSASERGGEDR